MANVPFRENEWVILGCPDGGDRLHQIKPSEMVDLGRFGRFLGQHLVGRRSGEYFWVLPDGSLEVTSPVAVSEVVNNSAVATDPTDIRATNQTLNDTNTSQRLSTTDIEALKSQVEAGSMSSLDIVKSVIENSETFEVKNAFSQIKYVQRKQRKFMKWFTVRKVTVRTLTNYFIKRDPRKIMDLRLDISAQLLCLANVAMADAKILIWDETVGFLTGAVMEKLSSTATIVNVHADRQMQVSSLMYYNFNDTVRSQLLPLPIDSIPSILARTEADNYFDETSEKDAKILELQRHRFISRRDRLNKLKNLLESVSFDTLIIATYRSNIEEITERLQPYLKASAKLVIYSTWRELLLSTYASLRRADGWVDVSLQESFLRPYQTAVGRLHPEMNCNGHAGTILSATKIIETTNKE